MTFLWSLSGHSRSQSHLWARQTRLRTPLTIDVVELGRPRWTWRVWAPRLSGKGARSSRLSPAFPFPPSSAFPLFGARSFLFGPPAACAGTYGTTGRKSSHRASSASTYAGYFTLPAKTCPGPATTGCCRRAPTRASECPLAHLGELRASLHYDHVAHF